MSEAVLFVFYTLTHTDQQCLIVFRTVQDLTGESLGFFYKKKITADKMWLLPSGFCSV